MTLTKHKIVPQSDIDKLEQVRVDPAYLFKR